MARAASSGLARGREEEEPKQVPSGRLLLRMPRELHAELTRSAERDGVSLNQFITTALARAIGWNGEGVAPGEPSAERQARWIVVALFANVAVIGLAAIAALVLLVLAWQG